MSPFAEPADLATFLQTATEAEATEGSPDVLDTAVAVLALEAASADIRAVCGWSITEETVTDEPHPVERWIHLPTLNLTAVSISYNGSALPTDAYLWRAVGVIDICGWHLLVVNRTGWWRSADLLITYTHGYDVVPDVVRTVCLERAAQRYVNPTQDMSHTRGEITTVFARGSEGAGSVGSLLNDSRLAPYKLPGVA